MTDTRSRTRFPAVGALAAFACLAGCASAPALKEGDLDVLPKANKHYVVDGATISFADLEARVMREPPGRLIVETARERNGTACVVMLGFRHDVPVWSRWPNGRMQQIFRSGAPRPDDVFEACR